MLPSWLRPNIGISAPAVMKFTIYEEGVDVNKITRPGTRTPAPGDMKFTSLVGDSLVYIIMHAGFLPQVQNKRRRFLKIGQIFAVFTFLPPTAI